MGPSVTGAIETGEGSFARVAIPVAGGIEIIPVGRIDWLESDGNYVRVHIDGSPRIVRGTLRGFIARLDPGRFRQVHRTAVVNIIRIAGVRAGVNGDGTLVLTGGETLRLSRRYRQSLLEVLLSPAVSD